MHTFIFLLKNRTYVRIMKEKFESSDKNDSSDIW